MSMIQCENCAFYQFDDESETYYCSINLEEDEAVRFMEGVRNSCPYFRFYDEYKMVNKQI